MIVSFLGSPASGKTTLAAKLFAAAKEHGQAAELVMEQARLYIANQRRRHNLKPSDQLILSPQDQLEIFKLQVLCESTMADAVGPEVIVITDTSPLNTLLYMTPDLREHPLVQHILNEEVLPRERVTFYCKPVHDVPQGLDPNRIHSLDQSLAIDKIIPDVVSHYAPKMWEEAVVLMGDLRHRFERVMEEAGR